MRRPAVLILALMAALSAGLLAAVGAFSSSHREAPRIMLDPAADNTDVYAFTAPDAQDSLTVVSNWVPLEEPAGGPYFGKLDPRARYYVKIDNTGDGDDAAAFGRWVVDFGMAYAELTRRDHALFVDAFRSGRITGVTGSG